MKKITTITYKGNCPKCGVEQTDTNPNYVDTICWNCSVNNNLLIDDILSDIKTLINHNRNSSHSIAKLTAYKEILQIIKKHNPNMVNSSKIMEMFE